MDDRRKNIYGKLSLLITFLSITLLFFTERGSNNFYLLLFTIIISMTIFIISIWKTKDD